MNLPEQYLTTIKEMLGNEFDEYLESFNDDRLFGLRVNTLKISISDFLKISPFELEPIPWIENGFYFSQNDKPAKHPFYFAGLYYIQEPSAMTPANVLLINEGDKVFDMCAAPGGKSTELGAKLNRTGLLIANDISNTRAKALLKNIEMAGIPNLMVLSEDPKKLIHYYKGFFDKVLIDAPCSGEGMFRKDNKLIKSWENNGPEFYHEIQKELLLIGADMLKPGGMLLYSTCTFSKVEDEQSIRYLLNNRPEISIIDIKEYNDFSHGYEDSLEDKEMNFGKMVRIWPHKMRGEGHFVALLQKSSNSELINHLDSPDTKSILPVELLEFIEHVTYPIDKNEIEIIDEHVYVIPKSAGNHKGLRMVRSGLLLGVCKKNRFEPSQALAMAMKMDDYSTSINMNINDSNVIKYLKGETIEIENIETIKPSGWQLICVDSFPLGWGKLSGTTLKNKYCASWRWM